MAFQFQTHYTLDQARALLPQVRQWLSQLRQLRDALFQQEEQSGQRLSSGHDLGGEPAQRWLRAQVGLRTIARELLRRDLQLKDIDRGLVDFPALRDGREVFLCWEDGEEDIGYWHDVDAGYAGREPL